MRCNTDGKHRIMCRHTREHIFKTTGVIDWIDGFRTSGSLPNYGQ